jgi:LacI family transcriptional regulator
LEPKKKRVTMREVAERAGVSKSTVSHVINETRFVEEATKQRVLQAIKDLDYRPSKVARGLAVRQTHTAGLLISDVGNPFYHQVILGVEDTALANDYSVFLFNASYDLDRSMKYILSMIDRRVDGVMFMSSRMSIELVNQLEKHQIPAVVLDWEATQIEGVAGISYDFESGIQQAVDHLIELGHTQFAHVSGPLDLWTVRARQNTFLAALQCHGIHHSNVTIVEGNLRIGGGRKALQQLLKTSPRPTAVFAANDLTALGLMWEARDYGLQIPNDLSVIGLDDIALASEITPTLTTIALPCYHIGCLATNMLLELIRARDNTASGELSLHQVVQTKLVIRQSTGVFAPTT